MNWFTSTVSEAGDFVKGTAEGVYEGAKGTIEGVGTLAKGAYHLATSTKARTHAWEAAVNDAKAAGDFAKTAAIDPGKAAAEVGSAVSGAWDSVSKAYQQAVAEGHGSEFLGTLFGQGLVLVGTAAIPGGAEAEAVGAIGDAGRIAELAAEAGKASEVASAAGDAGKIVDVTAAASKAETSEGAALFEAPRGLGDIEAPRTPGLGEHASMSELVRGGAVPGTDGVILSDQVGNPAELYSDMFKLSQQNGVEYALTREDGNLVLRSGAPNRVSIPADADPVAHTHPFDPEVQSPQKMPSRADVNALNRRWSLNPDGARPASDVVWGHEPDHVTRYHATGLDEIPDPTKGGLKPSRRW